MEAAKLSSPIYTKTSDSTRLMIGLKWEPRQVQLGDRASSGFLTSFFYGISLLLWLPSKIVGFFTGIGSAKPKKVSAQFLYETTKQDKKEDNLNIREKDYNQYDLDLKCFVFDESQQLSFIVGPEEENLITEGAELYHSGEDFTGRGVYDDETIFIDLNKTTNAQANFFIVIISDCKFDFGSLDNQPVIRIVDSKFQKNLISNVIPTTSSEALRKFVYIYAKLSQRDGIWTFHPINEFCVSEEETLKKLKSHLG